MQNIPDMSQIKKLAQSPAGQQLLALLRSADQGELNRAAAKASAGDYGGAMQALSTLLSNPDAQKLLKEMEAQK